MGKSTTSATTARAVSPPPIAKMVAKGKKSLRMPPKKLPDIVAMPVLSPTSACPEAFNSKGAASFI